MEDQRQDEIHDRELYALLLENVEEYAIFMMDRERQITSWNPGVERILGYSKDEFIGQSGDMIFTPEDRAAEAPITEMQQASLHGNALDERWHIRKDGSCFWGTGIMVALYTSEKELEGFAKILRDNTMRKQAQDALQAREQQLQALNQQLAEFNEQLEEKVQERTNEVHSLAIRLSAAEYEERKRIAHVLHDNVQQMLYGILMRIHLLELDVSESGAQVGRHLEELHLLANRAIETTRSLSVELSPPIFEGDSVVKVLQWLAEHVEQLHGLTVTVTAQEDCIVPMKHLRVMIFQIVQELLFNVVKHAGVKRASVTLTQTNEDLTVTVADEGRGFNVDALPSTEEAQGGFGLSSIRERLRLFQGTLEIHSQQGEGTQAVIVVPLQSSKYQSSD